jgi:hypothetical protein
MQNSMSTTTGNYKYNDLWENVSPQILKSLASNELSQTQLSKSIFSVGFGF